MLSISDVPYVDIIDYLVLNNQIIPTDQQMVHQASLNLIYSGKGSKAPPSIVDFIIAKNLQNQGFNSPIYNASSILITPNKDLQQLSNELTLPTVDKERIIRILGYLGFLNNDMNIFDQLPLEILKSIMDTLDCKSILLICQITQKFSKFCQENLENILRENLAKSTGLHTNNYTRQQALNLCQMVIKSTISAGENYSLMFKNGQIYACGLNTDGQLGLGDTEDTNIPTLIPDLINIVQVSAGGYHSLVLSNISQVYAFGNNNYGQLGLGDNIKRYTPVLISNINYITQISAGLLHSLILSLDGNVYSCGSSGLGDDKNIFTLIPNLPFIIQISAGGEYSLILTSNGEIYAFGQNNYGQLGLGDNEHRYVPTLIKDFIDIIAVSAGINYSLILSNIGQVYSFGYNGYTQLGLGDNEHKNIPVLIKTLDHISSISSGYRFSLALTNNGDLYFFGFDIQRRYIKIPYLIADKIKQISVGNLHALLATDADQILAFGYNYYGQLGLGNYDNAISPIKVISMD